MGKLKVLVVVLIFVGACSVLENDIRQAWWKLGRPAIYYIEITDVRLGEPYHSAAIVTQDQIIRLEPENDDENVTVYTVEELFELLQAECGLWNTDCQVDYDNRYGFIAALGIYDWRGLRVERFSECPTIQNCPVS